MNDERNDDARPVERSWRQLILGGFVALLGLALLVYLLYSLARDVSLWVFGTETTAEVDELWVERTSPEDAEELTFDYHVSYHFTTPNGRTLHNASTLDVREWGALKVGGPVDVVYFAPYPAHNRLEEGRYVTVLACAYVPLFLAAWALLGG
ncbi:MAG: DUF3592 domain-containing protein, partial [Anaerolineae bacterium]